MDNQAGSWLPNASNPGESGLCRLPRPKWCPLPRAVNRHDHPRPMPDAATVSFRRGAARAAREHRLAQAARAAEGSARDPGRSFPSESVDPPACLARERLRSIEALEDRHGSPAYPAASRARPCGPRPGFVTGCAARRGVDRVPLADEDPRSFASDETSRCYHHPVSFALRMWR